MISYTVTIIFRLIYLIILFVVLLSWIPIFDVRKEPVAGIVRLYELIMAPFKAVIPPVGMLDISPIVAFIVLQFLEKFIVFELIKFGL